METPRVRKIAREVPLTPLSFVKSPATSPAALGQSSRRGIGIVNPILDTPSRKHFANTSTLNLFADPNSEDVNVSPSPRRIRGIADHNMQSQWTQEWSKSGLKHVPPPQIIERVHGLKIVPQKADAYHHSIHVVGSSPPPTQETPSRGIRCATYHTGTTNGVTPNRAAEDVMGQLLRFDPTILSDVERKNAPKRSPMKSHEINKMQHLRVVIADHVTRRKGGVSSFYVALTRGMVGNLPSVPQTPRSVPYELSAVADEKRQLSLESLRDQLEALTRTEISLRELADALWNMEEVDDDCGEGLLASCPVSFHDFAKTFATVGDNPMLKVHKV